MKKNYSKQHFDNAPLLIKLGKIQEMDRNVYDHKEKYIDSSEMLDEGTYWMGSNTSNTMCNNFTFLGADKKRHDDTKERS
jgi:hypothetical protein